MVYNNFFVKYIYMYNYLYADYKKKYLEQTAGATAGITSLTKVVPKSVISEHLPIKLTFKFEKLRERNIIRPIISIDYNKFNSNKDYIFYERVGPAGGVTEYEEMKGKVAVFNNKIATEDTQKERVETIFKNEFGESYGFELFKSVYLKLLEKYFDENKYLEVYKYVHKWLINKIITKNKESIDDEDAELIQDILNFVSSRPRFQIYVYSL